MANSENRPNIVMLLTDDQGPWAVPWEMPELHMPNLAALAAEGTRLDQFYCASPVCSPARASLLTGRMPSAHGVHDWLTGTRHPDAHPDIYLKDQLTLPEILRDAGYRCGMVGKWHVGESWPPAPGFDYWYAHRFGGGPYFNAPIWSPTGAEATEPEYFTDAVANHATDFINTADDRPFFLYAATTAPHSPWESEHHPDDLLDLYRDETFPSVPREPIHPWAKERAAAFANAYADPTTSLRGYCAALSGVDRLIGQIRDTLAARSLADNTVIIYLADNGFSCGHHGFWGKGNGTWPLNFWDSSVRVPAVIYLPPALRPAAAPEIITAPISALDLFPTLTALAAAPAPSSPLRPGESFLPLLQQAPTPDRSAVVFDEYGRGRMLRTGEYKYIERSQGPAELYDLHADPGERHNLAANPTPQTQAVIADLSARLRSWFAAHESPELSAYHRPVTGHGQIHPLWRQKGEATYVQEAGSHDGT